MQNTDGNGQGVMTAASQDRTAVAVAKLPGQKGPGRKPIVLVILGAAALLGLGYGTKLFIHSLAHEDTDNAFIEGIAVQVSPQISGHVVKVAVKDNQHVSAGDLLVQVDPRDYQTRVDFARAALAGAEARLRAAESNLAMIRKTAVAAVDQEQGALDAARTAIDTARIRLALTQSMGVQAGSRVKAAEAQVEQAKAEWEAAEAEATRAKADLVRYDNLFKTGGVTASQLDQYAAVAHSTAAAQKAAQRRIAAAEAQANEAVAGLQTAKEDIRQAESQIKAAEARLEEAKGRLDGANVANERIASAEAEQSRASAEIRQLKAELDQAELNLSYTQLTASQAGTITKKAVEEGNYVRPGEPLMALVSDDKWVIANFKETQIEYMRPGQPVLLRLDSYPHTPLRGHVDSLQRGTGARFSLLPAENATGNYVKVVQRVPVKIVFDGDLSPELALSLGMSVVPDVKVK
jgi:membrane fusion protein, multidrug efflux system